MINQGAYLLGCTSENQQDWLEIRVRMSDTALTLLIHTPFFKPSSCSKGMDVPCNWATRHGQHYSKSERMSQKVTQLCICLHMLFTSPSRAICLHNIVKQALRDWVGVCHQCAINCTMSNDSACSTITTVNSITMQLAIVQSYLSALFVSQLYN